MQGWIINISDVEAVHEGPHHAAYAASKASAAGMGRGLNLQANLHHRRTSRQGMICATIAVPSDC